MRGIMPIYEYQCEACGTQTEIQQKMSDPAPASCDKCGKGPMTKLISQTSFVLKGGGWYTTDFRDKGKPASGSAPGTAAGGKAADPKSQEKVEPVSKPADHKTED